VLLCMCVGDWAPLRGAAMARATKVVALGATTSIEVRV